MNDNLINRVSRVLGPREAALHPGGVGGEINLVVGTSRVRVELPVWLIGAYVEVLAVGGNVAIQCGDGSVDVDETATNTVTSEAIVLSDTVGRMHVDGVVRTWTVASSATHMALEADTASTEVNISVASKPLPL